MPDSPGTADTPRFHWPVKAPVSQEFGVNNHPGIDLSIVTGTPIHAAASGTVRFAGWNNGGYGNLVIVDHGGGFSTYYAHQSAVMVHQGQQVASAQVLGLSGSTGNSTGPHLHFEIRKDERVQNPRNFITGEPKDADPSNPLGDLGPITGQGNVEGGGLSLPNPIDVVGKVLGPFQAVSKFAEMVSDPKTWWRVALVVMGGGLAITGAVLATKDQWEPKVKEGAQVAGTVAMVA